MSEFVPRCDRCGNADLDPAFVAFGAAVWLCRGCADAWRWESGIPPLDPDPAFYQPVLIGTWNEPAPAPGNRRAS